MLTYISKSKKDDSVIVTSHSRQLTPAVRKSLAAKGLIFVVLEHKENFRQEEADGVIPVFLEQDQEENEYS